MNHSWGENHKTTSHRSSHTNVHGIYSSISNEIASRIERKRGRAMVKANCSNYLCWKSKRAFLPAGSKQHCSKSWGRGCSPGLAPPLLLPTGPYLAAFGSSFPCCWFSPWKSLLLFAVTIGNPDFGSSLGNVQPCRASPVVLHVCAEELNWTSIGSP